MISFSLLFKQNAKKKKNVTIFDINCRVSYLSDKTGMSVTSLSDDLYYISLYLTIGYIEGVYWVSISSLSALSSI